ncbi:MAG: AraC family transcriptional regulator [Acidobacteriota bacterium]
MSNALLFYREESPSSETAHFVFSYWEFKVDEDVSAPLMHEVFPDGCLSIVFYQNKTNSQNRDFFINELHSQSIFVPVNAGEVIWGMRILPEAAHAFFGANPAEFKSQTAQKQCLGTRFSPELEERLAACQCFPEAIEVYENYAKNFGVKSAEIDARLAKATRIFIETEGQAKISDVSGQIGLSERQFERNYRKASGLTPKQFARICRFRATTLDMIKNSANNWADRAAAKGFTDQSHLNREFSNLTGNSPVQFSSKIKRIKHGKIIE